MRNPVELKMRLAGIALATILLLAGFWGTAFWPNQSESRHIHTAQASKSDRKQEVINASNSSTKVKANCEAILSLGKHRYCLEVAKTSEAQQRGLMGRTHLSAGHGMLFVFSPARVVNFWMARTLIPLDVVFFRNQQVVHWVAQMQPCTDITTKDCPRYSSQQPVSWAVELPAGSIQQDHIKTGMHAMLIDERVSKMP
ncbi:MAG: DUF192 domain-containing protein [Cyanobacteria bacterium P01_H01_bin.74]